MDKAIEDGERCDALTPACGMPSLGASYAAPLTTREIEVLEWLGKGLSMKGTAQGLDIAPGTVKWHVKNVYEKLDARSRDEALRKARLRRLIQ